IKVSGRWLWIVDATAMTPGFSVNNPNHQRAIATALAEAPADIGIAYKARYCAPAPEVDARADAHPDAHPDAQADARADEHDDHVSVDVTGAVDGNGDGSGNGTDPPRPLSTPSGSNAPPSGGLSGRHAFGASAPMTSSGDEEEEEEEEDGHCVF